MQTRTTRMLTIFAVTDIFSYPETTLYPNRNLSTVTFGAMIVRTVIKTSVVKGIPTTDCIKKVVSGIIGII